MNYANGESEIVLEDSSDNDKLFDSKEEAIDEANYLVSCSRQGAEIMNMSNPSDYDYDEDEYIDDDYEIIEVDEDDD